MEPTPSTPSPFATDAALADEVVTIPTMDDLDRLAADLDEVDRTLAELDAPA